jgi:hypothetical protein
MTRKITAGLYLALGLCATAGAAVPTSITVQGKLTDSTGAPFAPGAKQFVFSIHDSESGGSKIWPLVDLEYQMLTTDGSGLWTANVGGIVPLTDFVFLDSVRWLEVAVDVGTPVVLPRVRLVTGPYTFRVSTVDGASGGTITSKLAIGPGHTNSGEQGFTAGADNFSRGAYSSVSGGKDNIAFSDSTHVGGGGGNTAFGLRATVGGGADNETGGEQTTIAGGRFNKAMGLSSSIGGGYENIAMGVDAHIGGGSFDSASGNFATVAGGTANKATGNYNTIGGGGFNRTSAASATVAGGFQNVASADDATVGGGYNNEAAGFRSTVPGGTGNAANGDHSFACGVNAWVTHDQTFMWNDDPNNGLLSTAPNYFIIGCSGRIGMGTNSPEAYLHVHDGSAGAVTASGNSIAVFERDASGYISVLTPSGTERGIFFGGPGNPSDAGIIYTAGTEQSLDFLTEGSIPRLSVSEGVAAGYGSRLSVVGPVGTASQLRLAHHTGTGEASLTFDSPPSPNVLSLAVMGLIKMTWSTTSTSINGPLSVGGDVCAPNVACPSDERLKRDIHPIQNALADVRLLNGVEYHWKDDVAKSRDWSNASQIGLLAQDVQKVAPQAVVAMPDGYLAVDYARLVPLLIEAIKAQQIQIDELKEQLDRQSP